MDFHEEVKKLLEQHTNAAPTEIDNTLVFHHLDTRLGQLDKHHKEILYRLEEVSDRLDELPELPESEDPSSSPLLHTLIDIIDFVEDFYILASSYEDSTLSSTSSTIFHTILKKASLAGLTRIHDEGTAYDFQCNTIEGVEEHTDQPESIVLKTLKSGYAYDHTVIRKSKVVINKRKDVFINE